MLRAGIFLDVENLVRSGGWGIRFRTVRDLVEKQGATVLRANAYMAVDREREGQDPEYRIKKSEYRDAVRRAGYRLSLKEVQRYTKEDGQVQTKADIDLELAVDAMQQSSNLDVILLGSGDGNYLRLVTALQNRGLDVSRAFARTNFLHSSLARMST